MRTTMRALLAPVLAGLVLFGPAAAQQPSQEEMMAAWAEAMAVGEQHQAFADRAGTWAMTTTYQLDPNGPPIVERGMAERAVTMGGRVLEERVDGQMMGNAFHGLGRMGYDNVTGRYWSTWTDTTSTALIVLYGDYDAASNTYVFEGEATDPLMGPMTMRVETTIEGPDRDRSMFYIPVPGSEADFQMMEIVYERQ